MPRLRSSTLGLTGGLAEFFERPPYSVDQEWRSTHLTEIIARLTAHHYEKCVFYRNILDALEIDPAVPTGLPELPFLPIGLFKRFDLTSVPASAVRRTLTSSGTGRSVRARVHLDRQTSMLQMLALARIGSSFLGANRLPLLIIDAHRQPGDEAGHAARVAAIEGFSLFAAGATTFALTGELVPDLERVAEFLDATQGRPFLLFGFTYVIWRHFFEHLDRNGIRLDLRRATLVHGGGWKKLAAENVSDAVFRERARECAGITRMHNYYGTIEQPGSIYLQCEKGFLHCSNFSEIFIRRPTDLSIGGCGETGIIQTLSVLPRSYPGHNLLTEDIGVVYGEDDCDCGRLGKRFEVFGRAPAAEPRGCGDTYSSAS
jgi:hypothetical protein